MCELGTSTHRPIELRPYLPGCMAELVALVALVTLATLATY